MTNAKPAVLANAPLNAAARADLGRDYELLFIEETADRDAFLAAHGPRVRAIVTDGPRFIQGPDMDRLPNLELIFNRGVGMDKIDIAAARARGISVANGRGSNESCVADHVFALLLAVVRRIIPNDRTMREDGADDEGRKLITGTISGKAMGILGLGQIGLEVAKRAQAFDMTVHYHNRNRRNDVDYRYHGELANMASAVDYLIVTCPGGPATENMVNAEVLQALGPEGVLVNVARGSVVDTAALVRALETGAVGGAGLDVIAGGETLKAPLIALENVVMTPHLAGNTLEAAAAGNSLTRRVLDAHFHGRPIPNKLA